jgi:hypothetical protein
MRGATSCGSRTACGSRSGQRQGDSKKLVGVIFHVPCQPPPRFGPNEGDLKRVWRQVHELLDELCRDAKGGGRQYLCIRDAARRVKLKPMLDSVQLVRVKE